MAEIFQTFNLDTKMIDRIGYPGKFHEGSGEKLIKNLEVEGYNVFVSRATYDGLYRSILVVGENKPINQDFQRFARDSGLFLPTYGGTRETPAGIDLYQPGEIYFEAKIGAEALV